MSAGPTPTIITPDKPATADELASLAKRMAALKQILAEPGVRAKYKIELVFSKARSLHGITPGMLSFWENGSKLHGGGDAKIYLCPGKYLGKSECWAPMPDMANSEGTIICTACGQRWRGEDAIGEMVFSLPMRKWAEVLYTYFRRFNMDTDIYCKFSYDDIRSVAKAQAKKQTWKGSQALERGRESRARLIYRLENIVKDLSNGADPETRFFAFLTA